jgi:hypothetical protein
VASSAGIVYNSVRNEFLMVWYNSEDKRVHGRRISPIAKCYRSEEFLSALFRW